MTWALGGAIAAAAVLAFAGVRRSSSAGTIEPSAVTTLPTDNPSSAPDATDARQGEVLEVLPVAKYTYLRLATSAGDVWAAVPSATLELHSRVQIVGSR
jgi:hypothetical protein